MRAESDRDDRSTGVGYCRGHGVPLVWRRTYSVPAIPGSHSSSMNRARGCFEGRCKFPRRGRPRAARPGSTPFRAHTI